MRLHKRTLETRENRQWLIIMFAYGTTQLNRKKGWASRNWGAAWERVNSKSQELLWTRFPVLSFFIMSFDTWESWPTGYLGVQPRTSIAASEINVVTVSFIDSMAYSSSCSKAADLLASARLNTSMLSCFFLANFALCVFKLRASLDFTNPIVIAFYPAYYIYSVDTLCCERSTVWNVLYFLFFD